MATLQSNMATVAILPGECKFLLLGYLLHAKSNMALSRQSRNQNLEGERRKIGAFAQNWMHQWVALYSYPLYKSSRAAKILRNTDRRPPYLRGWPAMPSGR